MQRSEKIKQDNDLKTYIERIPGVGKFNGGNKICCPLPGHTENTPSFHLANRDSWHCYGCDKGGSIIDFVQHYEGLSTPRLAMDKLDGNPTNATNNGNGRSNGHVDMSKPPPSANGTGKQVKQTKSKPPRTAYADMEACAKGQYHLPVELFKSAGFSDFDLWGKPHMAMPTIDGINRLKNLTSTGGKYYPDPTNGIVIAKKKTREDKKANGETPAPEDYVQAQWFRLPEAVKWAIDNKIGKNLVMCNGQTSTIAAQYYGIPAFCKTDGENTIPQWLLPELITLLSDGWKLYVALDCDNDGKGHKVATKIITQLQQFNPLFVDLGGDNGFDLADFCDVHKSKSWQKLQSRVAGLPGGISEQAIIDIQEALKNATKAQKAEYKTDLPQLLDNIESTIEVLRSSYSPPMPQDNPAQDAYQRFLEACKNPQQIIGLRSGMKQKDFATGGFQDGGIYTYLAETGSGKTTMCMSDAAHLLLQAPGLIVVGEAGKKQIIDRLVGHIAEMPWGALKKGQIKTWDGNRPVFTGFTEKQFDAISDAYKKVGRWQDSNKLNFADDSKPLTTNNLKTQLRRMVADYGVSWAIMESTDTIPTNGAVGLNENIGEAMLAFEDMARVNQIPIITTSQGGRNTKGRTDKRLQLYDGQGSQLVENKSFVLMTIYNHWDLVKKGVIEQKVDGSDETTYPRGTAEIDVRKSRDDGGGERLVLRFVGGAGWYDFNQNKSK